MNKNYYKFVFEIDAILRKSTKKNIQKAFDMIATDETLQNYVFNNVKSLKWFYPLKEKGYFNPENAPGPKPADEKGYVTIPVWNILPYLERVSKQVNELQGEKYIDELLNIIREVTEYHKATKTLDNHNTWSYFVKILVNIPNTNIPIDIIDYIPIWLDSKYSSTFLSHDLALELLPKFLPENPTNIDIEKAEKVFENLFEIKWKEKSKGYIETLAGMRDEPYLLVDQHWLADSLINKKNAHKVGKKYSEKPVYILADKLKNIFRREHSGSSFDVNIDNKAYRIVVDHTNDFEFSCFGGLIDDKAHSAVKAQEKLFRKMLYVPETQFNFTISNCRVAVDFANQMISKLNEIQLGELEDNFSYRMEDFYNHIFNDYSYIWYRDIANAPRYIPTTVKEFIAYIMCIVITARVNKDRTYGKNIIEKFLSKDFQYPLFRRIVIFIIGKYWDAYNDIFGDLLTSKDIELMLDDLHYKAELYTLLEKNALKLSPKLKEHLKKTIEKGPQRHTFDDESDQKRYENNWKLKWYSALKSDPQFARLYKEYRTSTGAEEHISSRESAVQTRTGPGPSPLSLEELAEKPNSEIAEILAEFKTKDWWEGPTEDALSDKLKESVKSQPEKYVDDLLPFLNISYKYINDLLWGLRDAWNNKRTYDWGKLLGFIKDYINRDDFWQDKLPVAGDHWKPNHPWIISTIGSLIQDGTKDDSWAFDESYNRITQEIISIIVTDEHIADLKSSGDERESHYVTDVHNTPLGNIIIALIYLSLRIARLQYKQQTSEQRDSQKWSDELKALYEKTFEKDVIEAYTLFGQYLANFMYLDKTWSAEKIKDLEKPKQEAFWRAFMTGYLNTIRVYDSIYKLPSMQNHYNKALETMIDDKDTNESVVHHVTIGYLRGDDALFNKILAKWQPQQITEVIEFFHRESNYLLKKDTEDKINYIEKVIEFWRNLYDKYSVQKKLSDDDRKILSNLSKLTIYFETLDEEKYNWLMLSAPHVHIDGNEHLLFEYLDNLKDKGEDKIMIIKHILQIILKMLENRVFWFARESMKSIVNYSYELDNTEIKAMADQICNILGASGIDYLRKTYEKYNK